MCYATKNKLVFIKFTFNSFKIKERVKSDEYSQQQLKHYEKIRDELIFLQFDQFSIEVIFYLNLFYLYLHDNFYEKKVL